MALTIVGQAAKVLDATSRTPKALKIRDLTLKLESVADDSLTWTARTADLEAASTILPAAEQTVSLFQGATRIFHGHVSDPRDIPYGTRVTILGPWWWLRRTQLTQTGTAGDRPTFDLTGATVADNLADLLTRAAVKGCPVGIGTIDAAIPIPVQKLSEMSFADAIADQLKWITDGVMWWDYSASPPAFNVTRRGSAAATTYALGNHAGEVTDFELSPQTDLRAERVELTYMTGSGAAAAEAVQASGTAAAGRTQVIPISGPERTDNLPTTFSDRLPVYISTTTPAVALTHAVNGLPALLEKWPTLHLSANSINQPSGGLEGFILNPQGNYVYDRAAFGAMQSRASVIPSGKTAVFLGLDGRASPPEWLAAEYGLEKWTVVDFWIGDSHTSGATPPYDEYRRADVFQYLRPNRFFYSNTITGGGVGNNYIHFIRRGGEPLELDVPVWLMPTAGVPATANSGVARSSTSASQIQLATAASSTNGAYTGLPIFWTRDGQRYGAFITGYTGATRIATLSASQQADHAPASGLAYEITGYFSTDASTYGYVAPPSGMAAALLSMQSWTPWTGRIVRKGASADGLGGMARKYNLSGARTALASMGALPRSITYEFRSLTTTIDLGSPSRHDFGGLAQRFRQSRQSNLT